MNGSELGMMIEEAVDTLSDILTDDSFVLKKLNKIPVYTILGLSDSFIMSDAFMDKAIASGIQGFWPMGSAEEKVLWHPSVVKVKGS